ncbi:MAG: AraC family transcriptional regulator [Candidatus Kapaibacterium sp.]|nr:MAG: AraC family transcriptional regulator [Candidatus Kapabacteria bacterium]
MNVWQQEGSAALIEEQHNNVCGVGEGLFERRVEFLLPHGKAHVQEWSFGGIEIRSMAAELTDRAILQTEDLAPRITLHFATREHSSSRYEGVSEHIHYASFEHNVMFSPFVCGEIEYEALEKVRVCEVRFTPEYFAHLVPEESPLIAPLHKEIARGKAGMVGKANFALTSRMETLLREIHTPARRGCLQKIFLESKVLELFVLQSEQIQQAGHGCRECGLCSPTPASQKRSERERLQEAFEIVCNSFAAPPTLAELARQVGLNEFTLKRGFKETFGTTVYALVVAGRMKKARELLLTGDTQQSLTIADIAEAVGYEHATHFTAAFKKYFGELPRSLRQ